MELLEPSANSISVSPKLLGQSNWIKNVDISSVIRENFEEIQTVFPRHFENFNFDGYVNYKNELDDIEKVKGIIEQSLFRNIDDDGSLMEKFWLLKCEDLNMRCNIISMNIPDNIGYRRSKQRHDHYWNSNIYFQKRNRLKSRERRRESNSRHPVISRRSILKKIPIETILIANPVNVIFYNCQLNKHYKKKVSIRNVSYKIARYQLVRRDFNSKFSVMFNAAEGERKNLAPGMKTNLTIFFHPHCKDEYIEEIMINVENGKMILIQVSALYENPILEGIIMENDDILCVPYLSLELHSFSSMFINIETNINQHHHHHHYRHNDLIMGQTHDGSNKKCLLSPDTANGIKLDCGVCFVGEEIIIKVVLINNGGDGRFLLLSEIDWHTMNINSISENNLFVIPDVTMWPAYFSLKKNDRVILHTHFFPSVPGLYIDKIFIVCDNYSDQYIDILGDGIIFHQDFIKFGKNLQEIPVDCEENNTRFHWMVELHQDNTTAFTGIIDVTNLCEVDVFYRWEKIDMELQHGENKHSESLLFHELLMEPMFGLLAAQTNKIFKISAITSSLILERRHLINLQFIVEDIPRLAVPQNCDSPIYSSKNKKRRCNNSVDICMRKIEVWKAIEDIQ